MIRAQAEVWGGFPRAPPPGAMADPRRSTPLRADHGRRGPGCACYRGATRPICSLQAGPWEQHVGGRPPLPPPSSRGSSTDAAPFCFITKGVSWADCTRTMAFVTGGHSPWCRRVSLDAGTEMPTPGRWVLLFSVASANAQLPSLGSRPWGSPAHDFAHCRLMSPGPRMGSCHPVAWLFRVYG